MKLQTRLSVTLGEFEFPPQSETAIYPEAMKWSYNLFYPHYRVFREPELNKPSPSLKTVSDIIDEFYKPVITEVLEASPLFYSQVKKDTIIVSPHNPGHQENLDAAKAHLDSLFQAEIIKWAELVTKDHLKSLFTDTPET